MSVPTAGNVAFVFPGQGSQRVGMLEPLSDSMELRRLLDAAEGLSGLPLREVAARGPADALAATEVAQPLLYLADWAWARALEAAGVLPAAVAGHSLGEFAALAFAGVYSVEAGLELVCDRARLMAKAVEASPGGMMAVLGIDREAVSTTLSDMQGVWVANDNAPRQVIVSGTIAGLEAAEPALRAAGAARTIRLEVAGPFHSPLMGTASDEFAAILAGTVFADARVAVVQNTHPEPTRDWSTIKERLAAQMASPVRWTETMSALAGMGIDTILEVGPGAALAGMGRRIPGLSAVAVDTEGLARAVEVVHR